MTVNRERETNQIGPPFVKMALFCERAIQDTEGVLTLIRVVDTVTAQLISDQPLSTMPEVPWVLTLVIGLVGGGDTAVGKVDIVGHKPDGTTRPLQSHELTLASSVPGSAVGTNLVITLQMKLSLPGQHWFDVLWSGRLLTRVPLQVRFEQISEPPPEQHSGQGETP